MFLVFFSSFGAAGPRDHCKGGRPGRPGELLLPGTAAFGGAWRRRQRRRRAGREARPGANMGHVRHTRRQHQRPPPPCVSTGGIVVGTGRTDRRPALLTLGLTCTPSRRGVRFGLCVLCEHCCSPAVRSCLLSQNIFRLLVRPRLSWAFRVVGLLLICTILRFGAKG